MARVRLLSYVCETEMDCRVLYRARGQGSISCPYLGAVPPHVLVMCVSKNAASKATSLVTAGSRVYVQCS